MGFDLDVGLVADIRFPGGTSTALISEMRALRCEGLNVALLPWASGVFARGRPPNPHVLAAVRDMGVPLCPPGADWRARLLLIHHPAIGLVAPARRPPLTAPRIALVAHHPAVNRDGRVQYDYGRACRMIREAFGVTPVVLPVGPAVRESLRRSGCDVPLHAEDWPNLIESEAWPQVALRDGIDRLVVGRHARPDPLKWPEPEVAALVYPERADLEFRMLGVDPRLDGHLGSWRANWVGLPFGLVEVRAFLAGLDAYAYYYSSRWIEAFGLAPLEAMASGLPTILPPEMRATFGEGPIYAGPAEVGAVYDRLLVEPAWRQQAGAVARAAALRFGPEGFRARLDRLLVAGEVRRRPPVPRRAATALVVTSNGVGAGHISRQIAIAEAAPVDLTTVFFSLSKAARFARAAGFLTEYRPFHRSLQTDVDAWNDWFSAELREAIRFFRADVLVFDGNMPWNGLLAALTRFPGLPSVWLRRGMWRAPVPVAAERSVHFDLILEPGEFAAAADPRHAHEGSVEAVSLPPIMTVAPKRRLSRAIARRVLGLPDEGEVVLMSLGAGRNHDMRTIREQALEALSETVVFELVNPLAEPVAPVRKTHLLRSVYPAALYLAAFDAAILAAGYNFFHEAIAARLPTLFVPNTAPEMDLQEVRADHAARCGWALACRAEDPYGGAEALARLRDPAVRAALAAGCAGVEVSTDGASLAAELVSLVARQMPAAA